MGFPLKYRKWILKCVSTTFASMLVNGSLIDEILMCRETLSRQGDIISPFLFLIGVKGLNVMLIRVVVDTCLFQVRKLMRHLHSCFVPSIS